MPRVGNKKFPYTPEGLSDAQEYAAETGIQVDIQDRYNLSGLVRRGDGDVDMVRTRGSGVAVRGSSRRVKKEK